MKNGLQGALGVCQGGSGSASKAQGTSVFGGTTSGSERLGLYTGVWKTEGLD